MFKGKKVLIAGGTGFIGINFINRLLELGADVRATLHKKPAVINNASIEYVRVDLRTPEGCAAAVAGVDYVFMCAANTSGAGVIQNNPLAHVTPNVLINTLMLEAAHRAMVKKYLWLSSSTVYPPANRPVKEHEMMSGPPFEKYFAVAWMKRFSEALCEIYSTKIRNPMTTVVVRPANVYG